MRAFRGRSKGLGGQVAAPGIGTATIIEHKAVEDEESEQKEHGNHRKGRERWTGVGGQQPTEASPRGPALRDPGHDATTYRRTRRKIGELPQPHSEPVG